jgi:hypothetical protein
MDDRLLDALLERSRDQAGGPRLTGEGSMLGELVRAVLERALVPKRSGRVAGGLDDMVISLYAHGMSVRDIIHHLRQV